MVEPGRLLVLYGSQTFTAQEAAERIWRTSKALGFRGPVQSMDEYPISKLIYEEYAIFVCSTTGQGDEPDNMKKFWKFLLRKSLPANSLSQLKFGVLGLGDSSYLKFNYVGKKLHKRLLQLGAKPLLDLGLCDYQHDLGHDAVMQPWLKNFYNSLKRHFPDINLDETSKFVPRWTVSLIKSDDVVTRREVEEDIYFKDGTGDCNDAMLFKVVSNLRTTDESYFQDVRLMGIKRADGSNVNYKPGDVFNVRPRNSKEDVKDLFGIFRTHNLDIKPHYRLLVKQLHKGKIVFYGGHT